MESQVIAIEHPEETPPSGWRTFIEPHRGARITVEVTGAESGGEFVRLHGFLPPHSGGPPRHIHRTHAESFTVLAGRLEIEAGGQVVTIGPGETVTAPAGMPHTFRNDSDEEVELINEARPAARFEEGLRALFGLAGDGRTDPINFAMALRLGEALPARPPAPVARVLVAVLAWIGDRLGRDGSFPEYTVAPPGSSTSAR
jgi:mannose-6-phosphate isomerase-like protein (cupin superfamily)